MLPRFWVAAHVLHSRRLVLALTPGACPIIGAHSVNRVQGPLNSCAWCQVRVAGLSPLADCLKRCWACPVTQGSHASKSGRTAFISGIITRSSTFDAMVFPSMRLSAIGCSQSAAWIMDGRMPCARHASVSVARLRLLPSQGGCFRAWSKHGKWVVALRDPCRARDT